MSHYNLLDESWIKVIHKDTGETHTLSLIELFNQAGQYTDLAGESAIQDFSVFRLLLATLHTVFSRFDSKGEPYLNLEMGDRYTQLSEIDEDDQEEYEDDLRQTWVDLWESKQFPGILNDYLEAWRDSFYLLSDSKPFFQVTEAALNSVETVKGAKPTVKEYKNIRGDMYESSNKDRILADITGTEDVKNAVNLDELTRWVLTYQGYSNTADKSTMYKEDTTGNVKSGTYGWLYSIGGVYLKGDTLFDTLMLNLVLVHPEEQYRFNIQKPYWEYSELEWLQKLSSGNNPDNLAELYTYWGRLIYIESTLREGDILGTDGKTMRVIKALKLDNIDYFLEPMTVYQYDKKEESYRPRQYKHSEKFWQHMGRVYLGVESGRKPGIIDYYHTLPEDLGLGTLTVQSVGAINDGNATSWSIKDIYNQSIIIKEGISRDIDDEGWIVRINDEVGIISKLIGFNYGLYVKKLYLIRGFGDKNLKNQIEPKQERVYQIVDEYFQEWIYSIQNEDSKDSKVQEWRETLKRILYKVVQEDLKPLRSQDYRMVEVKKSGRKGDTEEVNIATLVNLFLATVNRTLGGS